MVFSPGKNINLLSKFSPNPATIFTSVREEISLGWISKFIPLAKK
ncbi:uncharacterized protein METZ01_LOCUS327395 [marine metagenome]|uniref:Uncharacterized protein n=1 Tax=marine metagenome TaxID=408172 RepID=A0A382PRD9_9ZZZZ